MSDTIKARLTRLSTNDVKGLYPMRSTETDGFFQTYPEVGKCFVFFSDPIDPNACLRVMSTSLVKKVTYIGYPDPAFKKLRVQFDTMNSTYVLDLEEAANGNVDVDPGVPTA